MFFRCNTQTISYFGLFYSIWGCRINAVLLQVILVGSSLMMSVLLLGWEKYDRTGRLCLYGCLLRGICVF